MTNFAQAAALQQLQQIDPATLAAAMQQLNGGNAAIESAALQQPTQSMVVYLVRLLQSRSYDGNTVVTTIGGDEITLQQILDSRVENTVRPNGSVGTDYKLAWALPKQTCGDLIGWLETLPQKKQAFSGGKRFNGKAKAAAAPQRQPAEESQIPQLMAQVNALTGIVAELVEMQTAPAKPVPSVGFTKVQPAMPVETSQLVNLTVGQVVMIDGEPRQLVGSADKGYRFNKTIVSDS